MAMLTEAGRYHRAASITPWSSPAYQGYQILHVAFTVAPIVFGLDKFFNFLTDWSKYLAPGVAHAAEVTPHTFMLVVGVVEIVAGLLVCFWPRVGAYVVTLWLWGIIGNLLMLHGYYDVALRDFGLSLGALALARMSQSMGREHAA